MKECPNCGYKNENNALDCDICHASLISVKPHQEEKVRKKDFIGLIQTFAGIFLICAAAYIFYPERFFKQKNHQIQASNLEKSGYDISSVIKSLESMGNLKFMGQEEKKDILSFTNVEHSMVRVIAIKILGKWVMNQEEESADFVKKIVESMKDSNPAVRAESARQIGLILLTKKIFPETVKDIKNRISILLKDTNESVRVNAIFLAAITKDKSWIAEFRRLFKNDISNSIKLQSACSLAYSGDRQAIQTVLKACSDSNIEIRKKAAFCLAYVDVKDSERVLKTIIDNDSDKNIRDFAKFSLNFRKQLAIINNRNK